MPAKVKLINCITLEVYDSYIDLAERLGYTVQAVYQRISMNRPIDHVMYVSYDDWLYWSDKEKERYSHLSNIYFLNGLHNLDKYDVSSKFVTLI